MSIIAELFRNREGEPYQNVKIIIKEKQNREELEDIGEKYNWYDIFKNRENDTIIQQSQYDTNEEKQKENYLIVIENFYRKLVNFIKRIFNI